MADKIEAEVAEWSSDANDAVELAIVTPGIEGITEIATFQPKFTYPIFGEEETIFGYKDLHIKISFAAHNLLPHAEISYAEKFKQIGDVKAPNLKSILRDFLPTDAFENMESYKTRIQNEDGTAFKPPGNLVQSYSRDGRNYEIWCGELSDPAVKTLIDRVQIMVSFFVEGGVLLNLEEEEWSLARWRVFFVYEKLSAPPTANGSVYSLCGYSTSYRFITYKPSSYNSSSAAPFKFPPAPISIASLPNRSRVSQFIILPPHQGYSHGRHLYNAMVEEFMADPACVEITVEDPNEAFDDLRDYCDFARFTRDGTFAQLQLHIDIDPKLAMKRAGVRVPTSALVDRPLSDRLRVRNKVAPRQWMRLVDMYLLSKIPAHSRQGGAARLTQRGRAADPGDRALYYWRLLVKQRIYRQNKDVMAQFDLPDRIERLEHTLEGQVDDYDRLLRRIEQTATDGDGAGTNGAAGAGARSSKRKVIDDDDDDGEDAASEPKRARTVEMGDGA